MMKAFVIAAFAIVFGSFLPSESDAKSGVRVVPMPGGGGGTIVKVLDLPDIPVLRRSSGVYVDLGYKWERGSADAWVGYIGSSSKYLALTPARLDALLAVAGVTELPPVPKKPRGKFAMSAIIFAGLVFVFAVFGALKRLVRGRGNKPILTKRRDGWRLRERDS